jgi:hypothetical protein
MKKINLMIFVFISMSCTVPELTIKEVKLYKVENYSEQFKDYKDFIVIYGSGFSIENNTITFVSGTIADSSSVDDNASILTLIAPENLTDGTLTLSNGEVSTPSETINFSQIESIVDVQTPIVTLNYVVLGTTINSFDINFTLLEDTVVIVISTTEGSVRGIVANKLWVSGTYTLKNIALPTENNTFRLLVVDLAGHTAYSDYMVIPEF